MKSRRLVAALISAAFVVLALPAVGSAATGTVTEFPLPTAAATPFGITAGPDGNVWFAENGGKSVGRITPAGVIKEFALAGASNPNSIAAMGNLLYVTDQGGNQVYVVTPDLAGGDATSVAGAAVLAGPRGIAAGPDGNLWVVNGTGNTVQRVNAAGAAVGAAIPTGGANIQFIAKGPDNNMWVTDFSDPGQMFKITTGATPTATAVPLGTAKNLLGVAAGPDGKVYFNETTGKRTGRINPDGTGLEFSTPLAGGASDNEGLAFGQDGNIYEAIFNTGSVGQITPTLGLTQFTAGITANAGIRFIAKGADGNMWFTEELGNRIGRFTVDPPPAPPTPGGGGGGTTGGGDTGGGTTGGGTTGTGGGVGSTPGISQVSSVVVKPNRFRVGTASTAVAAAKKPKKTRGAVGTKFGYSLTEDGSVTLLIEKVAVGRKSGSSCAKPSRKNRKAKRCTLYKKAGALSRNGLKGQNEVPFSGRIGSRKLSPGRYRVGISSTNAAGTGNPQFASFTVLPAAVVKARKK